MEAAVTVFGYSAAIVTASLYIGTALGYALVLAPLYAYNRSQMLKAQRALSAMQNHTMLIKQPAAARPIIYGRARVGGVLLFATTTGTNNQYLYIVVAHAGHECDGIEEYYLDNCKVTLDGSGNVTSAVDANGAATTKYNGKVVWKTHLGAAGQTVDSMLNTDLGGTWPTTSTLDNICYSVLKLTYDSSSFSSGMPNTSVLVRGKKVYDPRTATTVWSNNSALCVRDYLTDTELGFGAPSSEIDDTACISAANTCDEAVALTAGGYESRYTCNGIADTSTQAGAILADLTGSMAGNVCYVSGLFIIRAGVYATPTQTLTETDLRGPISITTRDSISDMFNGVKGVYISSVNLWQTGDFPPVYNSGYVTQDGGYYWRDIQLPFTTSSATAQRLAKIMLERERLDITVVFPAKLTALNIKVGDNVMVTLSRYGWSSQVFEVVNSVLSSNKDGDAPLLGVDLTLRLVNANAYNWNSGLETPVNAAMRSSLYNPVATGAAPAAPTGLASTPAPAASALKWNKSPEADFDHYKIYRSTTNSFGAATDIWTGFVTSFIDPDVTVGTTYYYWITGLNSSGNESSPSASVSCVPANATGATGASGANGVPVLATGTAAAVAVTTSTGSVKLSVAATMDGVNHAVTVSFVLYSYEPASRNCTVELKRVFSGTPTSLKQVTLPVAAGGVVAGSFIFVDAPSAGSYSYEIHCYVNTLVNSFDIDPDLTVL
jgi:hypothetical protein